MNKKFYVPFSTAVLLKEKGYLESQIDLENMYYDEKGTLFSNTKLLRIYKDEYPKVMVEKFIYAPTYCEVIDWLVQKEIYIDVDITPSKAIKTLLWHCYIWQHKDELKGAIITASYPTREKAINAAFLRVFLEELL